MVNPNDRTLLEVRSKEELLDLLPKLESFQVNGILYTYEDIANQLIINVVDLVTEEQLVAEQAWHWGMIAVNARRFRAQVEASYRAWKDRRFLEFKATPVGETSAGVAKFPTDGQAERMYRTHQEYGYWNTRRNDAQASAEQAEAVYDAFKAKKEVLKSMTDLLWNEAGGHYYVTERPRCTVARQPQIGVSNE